VPEVQDLHEIWRFMDSVINQYRRVNQLADAGASIHWGSNVWKAFQQIDVIQDCITESLRILGKPRQGVGEDFLKIR
jgi:hypothetical protein